MSTVLTTLALSFAMSGTPSAASAELSSAYSVLSGSNVIEQEIQWAWKYLPDFLSACLESSECKLTEVQKNIIQGIVDNRKLYSADSLIFVSEVSGQSFTSATGETERIAITKLEPGAKIYLNKDRYSNNGKSFGPAFWMGILTHELTHHLGIKDDTDRVPDQLGSSITQVAQALLAKAKAPEEKEDVTLYFLNPPLPDSTKILKKFANGLTFSVLSIDSQQALDDTGVAGLFQVMKVCDGGKFINIRVSPESVQSKSDQFDPATLIANFFFDADVLCVDRNETKAYRQQKLILHSVKMKTSVGKTIVDSASSVDWSESEPSLHVGGFESGTVLSLDAPSSIQAGSKLVIQAKIQARPELKFVGCTVWLTSDNWPHATSAEPFVVVADKCDLKKLNADTYNVSIERLILPDTPSMNLRILNFCLFLPDEKYNCVPARPVRKTSIAIVNSLMVQPLIVTDLHLERVQNINEKGIFYSYQDSFDLVFCLRNAKGLENTRISLYTSDPAGNGMELIFPFHIGVNPIVHNLKVQQMGTDLLLRVEMALPGQFQNLQPNAGQFDALEIITTDLKSIFVDLSKQKLTFKQARAVPR